MSETCEINEFSSRICEYGTKGCDVQHAPVCRWCGYPIGSGLHSTNGTLQCVIFVGEVTDE